MIDWLTKKRIVDQLGRIVIPATTLRYLKIEKDDSLAFYINGDTIILQKYDPTMRWCIFCGNVENLENIKNKYICQTCLTELKEYAAWEGAI